VADPLGFVELKEQMVQILNPTLADESQPAFIADWGSGPANTRRGDERAQGICGVSGYRLCRGIEGAWSVAPRGT